MRSAAKHRSDSAARSTPTRSAAKGHAQKITFVFTSYKKQNTHTSLYGYAFLSASS
ncbi:MAG: hypothetical protein NZ455_10060 [Bacteroidia bacterium]|nr:hypothetical protein [Bacteroidia bacterium]MDW8347145.1 hypothetical protein [Bacteroidia bacterium]